MTELEYRELIMDYLNGETKESELMNIAEIKECCTCGYKLLEEEIHENEDGYYCDVCWESR